PTRLSPTEQYTHLSLWSLLSAPLLIGCDLSRIDPFTFNLLANPEVLAINQDALGKAAERVLDQENIQVWAKEMADGSQAVGLFNLADEGRSVRLQWSSLRLPKGLSQMRDVWQQQDMGKMGDTYEIALPAHGSKLLLLK
ncbi:MAG TPA: alpha-galactosidase, partial [Saprospiraceae bacterium]|nr:alpha-galactosidase [Saprospiraceae bacterium]